MKYDVIVVGETFTIVEAAALIACELPDDHWGSRDGRLTRVNDFWERVDLEVLEC